MHHVLVYGDSLTWGIVPLTRSRLPFPDRWPGLLEAGLVARGLPVRITEDCLNGRRTVFEDPFKPGRNGLAGLEQRIESHSPLHLLILFLGTNDFQSVHSTTPWQSAQGVATLVTAVRRAPIEPGMPIPEILILAPPPIAEPRGPIAPKFAGASARSVGLAAAYEATARDLGCRFFDTGTVTPSSTVDGVHLDADQHRRLGHALVPLVAGILSRIGA
jgi:lysophospholipase L1-like esterase